MVVVLAEGSDSVGVDVTGQRYVIDKNTVFVTVLAGTASVVVAVTVVAEGAGKVRTLMTVSVSVTVMASGDGVASSVLVMVYVSRTVLVMIVRTVSVTTTVLRDVSGLEHVPELGSEEGAEVDAGPGQMPWAGSQPTPQCSSVLPHLQTVSRLWMGKWVKTR